MKRVAVKRKTAGSGAKRNAPRRRALAKKTVAGRTKRGKSVKPKAASPSKVSAKQKTVARKLHTALGVARSNSSDSTAPDTPSLTIDLPVEADDVPEKPKVKAQNLSRPDRTTTNRKTTARRPRLTIPPILLEGDEPELPAVSGPGEKFSLGPETPAAHFAAAATHLPATYGTGRLFLTARDPHWIYAHWDMNSTVQFQHNARSVDRHLILRLHEHDLASKPAAEIHVHPESRHWFAHVERAGEQYVGDLGYYQPGRKWKSLATSTPMRTPPDTVSTDSTVEFATIPAEVPFETMLSLLKEGEEGKLPLAHAIQHLRDRRLREFPPTPDATTWTPEQERAMAEIIAAGRAQRALRGSQEIAALPGELPFAEDLPTGQGPFGLSSSFGEYISSPLGGEQIGPEFWFNVSAELIVYGSTKPDAKVSVGGKPIALQPDGSFSFRFALPDGQYEIPVVAVSADDTDGRAAKLRFSRSTEFSGHVGAQLQDPTLKPPTPDNI